MGEAAGKFFKNGRVSAVGVITVSSPQIGLSLDLSQALDLSKSLRDLLSHLMAN